ncbi:di-heme-cytochrome C peroxidase [Arenicella sp. 4NH20-0111]|uniref:di-heme-cytochrome C peroxidase n=1 Tax=Arenicella sp. 4NH20-0111 TaxID=3127648 RepID=UPI0031033288
MRLRNFVVMLVASLALSSASGKSNGVGIEDGTPIAGADKSLINLDQGWSQEMQAGYWYGGDGSLIVPYDWFLVLEQASSDELFRSAENIERLRYTSIPKSKWNPNGMPAGFAKNIDNTDGSEWMALSCGGCHSTKISYEGTSMVINGAATMGDFQTMMKELEEALLATLNNEEKFTRFAQNILGQDHSSEESQELRAELKSQSERQVSFNHTNRTPSKFGYGRVDAFAYAYNNIGVNFLGIPENHIDGVAPANYNFIWGTAQSDVLQWNGMAPNTPPIAPIFRVLGDVWGGGGKAYLKKKKWYQVRGYKSSADFKGLGDMLAWVKVLKSPKWPEFVLPKIDAVKAAKGSSLYDENCAQCHQVMLTREEQMKPYNAVMVPQTEVGTDRAELVLIQESVQKTGILEGTKMYYIAGEKLGPTTPAKNLLNVTSIGAMVRHPIQTIRQGLRDFTGTKGRLVKDTYQYKARPLNGIWSTAPYLHNGSVPNLYQLLLPSAQRDSVFYTGDREFDPVVVGQVSAEKEGLFKFDTSLYGNSNSGHEYGTQLSEAQRYELIEFLKTL